MAAKTIMNREIKFRAFQDGRMYYEVSTNGKRVFWGTSLSGGNEYDLPFNEVKIMQFTGLKDKNGKEIYEGDIIRWKVPKDHVTHIGFIFWNNDRAEWKVNFGKEYQFGFIKTEAEKNFEVLGNIYENKDLLK